MIRALGVLVEVRDALGFVDGDLAGFDFATSSGGAVFHDVGALYGAPRDTKAHPDIVRKGFGKLAHKV